MKKYYLNFLAAIVVTGSLFLLMTSCSFSGSGKVKSTGTVNELLIVTDDKAHWEGALGDSLRAFFSRNQVGLSQPEPVFDLLNVSSKDFNELFQRFHNIFIVEINPEVPSAYSETTKNPWSDPQRVIKVTAPDMASFMTEFNLKKTSFENIFVQVERERTLSINKLAPDIQLSKAVQDKFGIDLPFSGGFYIAKVSPDFMWIRHKVTKAKQDVELGILIYATNYEDTVVFNPRHILYWRNMITREFVPGPSPLSFMKVTQEFIPPVFTVLQDFPGGYAVETRGLWEVENDFMGGPFLSYTFVNKKTNKVITLDGYVYNPNNDKKNFLRQLEAIFWAVRF